MDSIDHATVVDDEGPATAELEVDRAALLELLARPCALANPRRTRR